MTISLRNLPPEIERAIVTKSESEGISLNKAATQLLELAQHADADPPADYHVWEEEYSRLKWAGHGSDE